MVHLAAVFFSVVGHARPVEAGDAAAVVLFHPCSHQVCVPVFLSWFRASAYFVLHVDVLPCQVSSASVLVVEVHRDNRHRSCSEFEYDFVQPL